MKIRIKDVNKTPMWAIHETDIFLSLEQNDFLSIDYSVLTPFQKQTIWAAIKTDTIEAEDDSDFQEDFREVLKVYLEERKETQQSNLKEVFGIGTPEPAEVGSPEQALNKFNKANDFKKVLGNSIATLKRLLPSYTAFDLELFREIETHNKSRKTVLSLIDSLITKQTKKNVSRVETVNAPTSKEYEKRQVFKGTSKQLLPNISDVRQSDTENVVIKIGDG